MTSSVVILSSDKFVVCESNSVRNNHGVNVICQKKVRSSNLASLFGAYS